MSKYVAMGERVLPTHQHGAELLARWQAAAARHPRDKGRALERLMCSLPGEDAACLVDLVMGAMPPRWWIPEERRHPEPRPKQTKRKARKAA